jgi:hypothetical protein
MPFGNLSITPTLLKDGREEEKSGARNLLYAAADQSVETLESAAYTNG